MLFRLDTPTEAKLAHLLTRVEKHGTEEVAAVTLSKLPGMAYREPILCRDCAHCKSKEMACGSQSFMTIYTCRKAEESVSPEGTCDAAKKKG